MPFPSDIQTFLNAHHPCPEGVERLAEHASMAAAWDASTHGSFLAYIIRKEGLETDAVKAVTSQHRDALKAAYDAARALGATGTVRLQDLHAGYAAALSSYAADLKAVAPNPFS
jgi:hypothetical protein